jgi:CxxC-x17-CxxC domain-containing protein
MDDRKMYTGDWTCIECGAKIDALPFEPRDPSTLTCRECHIKNKQNRQNRIQKIYIGEWKCMKCGKDIDELPFKPVNPDTILCRECHQEEKNNS